MTRQYIGARYVPTFYENPDTQDATWKSGVVYEPLTMVLYNNATYTSKKEVPSTVGDPASNPSYWVATGNYNGQIAYLQSEIGNLANLHTTNKDSLVDAVNELTDIPEFFFVITPDMSANEIKTAVATHNNIYIAPGTYEYAPTAEYDAFIIARSNMNIWIDGELSLRPNAFEIGAVVSVDQCSHVKIFGSGKLIGDKLTHTGATGEWQHGLNITNSNDVTVDGLTIEKAWGDGIYVGGYASSSDIIIKDIISNNNRRNSISVASASNVLVKDSIFKNTSGTAPEAGIAIETNGTDGILSNIRIVGCTSTGNTGGAAYASSHVNSSVYFEDCNLDASGTTNYAIAVTSLDASAVNNFKISNSILTGIYAIALGLNVNSKLVATDNIYQDVAYSVARATATVLNDLTITGIVKDSTVSEGFITAVGATITNSYFDFKTVNSTVSDVRRFSQMDNDTCIINIDSANMFEFIVQNSELWSSPTYIYSDDSYTAGMTQADLRYSVLRGIKYKIINTSSYPLTVLTPSGTVKGGGFNGTLASGSVLEIERINSTHIIVNMFTA